MGLYYLDRLHQDLKAQADAGRHGVVGMPPRSRYAADQGWDALFQEPVAAKIRRQGATAQGTPPSTPLSTPSTPAAGVERLEDQTVPEQA